MSYYYQESYNYQVCSFREKSAKMENPYYSIWIPVPLGVVIKSGKTKLYAFFVSLACDSCKHEI
jgi:hypothetical protein